VGYTPKRKSVHSGGGKGLGLQGTIAFVIETTGWTLDYIKKLLLFDFYYVIEGLNIVGEKREQDMKKHSGSSGKGGKFEVNSLSQLKNMPGVKTIKNRVK
jgi:hypothetical protein